MTKPFIYVASSWRNEFHAGVVATLRGLDCEVYDFKQDGAAFSWKDIDPNHDQWTVQGLRNALAQPLARVGFDADMAALRRCEGCLLVLPCGRSAHLELGWAIGQGKFTAVWAPPEHKPEPELMYLAASHGLLTFPGELEAWVRVVRGSVADREPAPPLPAGWGFPGTSKKAHYFQAGSDRSLCMKWGFYRGERENSQHEHSLNCAECKRRRAKLEKS